MIDYLELVRALSPEISLVIGALLVLGFDLVRGRNQPPPMRLQSAVSLGSLAIVAATWSAIHVGVQGAVSSAALQLDMLGMMSRVGVLVLAFFTVGLLPGGKLPRHPAELVAVMLFATAGFTLMSVAQQLLLVFLAIELASISLYILVGFDKSSPESAEAGLKYFLFGGMSAAFLLFGFSLLYGLTGSIELQQISEALQTSENGPLLSVALVMILVAFGFKAAAAPFHLWAPDVYQGAPPVSAALIASASKLAGITVFTRLLWVGLGGGEGNSFTPSGAPGWMTALALVSGASLLLGNLVALAQSNVRRLLAYSAIAHAGALLIGVLVAGSAGVCWLFYYATTYGLATIGAFGVIAVVDARGGGCRQVSDLAGLHARAPLLAACLMVFLLSLAGIPPLAGFFGKFAVFTAALRSGGVVSPVGVLTIAAIGLSAVALYYYLVVLKQAWVASPAVAATRIPVPANVSFALCILAALLLVLGLFPFLILQWFSS